MKTKHLLLVTCLSLGATTTIGQVFNSSQPDMALAPAPMNTGLAIAPALDVHAAVFDDAGGSYRIYWVDGPSGSVVDADANMGTDPDVAYYANADALVVAYEVAGRIVVDDYYLQTLFPSVDYQRFGSTYIAQGTYPNVDMNSSGNGILCWEDGGMVLACSFNIGTFTPGPVTMIASNATQPDIILLDDDNTGAITYVDQGTGEVLVEIFDYWALVGGSYVPWNIWNMPPMSFYEYPRIASQRNAAFSSAPTMTSLTDFAVVAQDFNGGEYEVHGFFFPSAGGIIGPMVLNAPLIGGGCAWQEPRPVVAFDRDKIDCAWSQEYSCAGLATGGQDDDIILGEFDIWGNNLNTMMFGFDYYEVNQVQSAFAGVSRTSLSTEYDGFYGISNSNYNEGVLFNEPGELLWKRRNASMPVFISEPDNGTHADVQTFSIENNPVKETIEVLSANDAEATFVLYDNAGRLLEVNQVSNGNNTYSIDISHLSGGTYFLKCTSSADEEVLKVLQVR